MGLVWKFVSGTLVLLLVHFMAPVNAEAGVIEIGAEGSFFRYNSSTDSYVQTYTIAGSVAYHFLSVTAIELSYSRNVEHTVRMNLSASSEGTVDTMRTRNQFEVASFNIVQFLVGGKSRVKPYLRVGVGYVIQNLKTTFVLTNGNSEVFGPIKRKSASGNAGAGIRFVITDNLYLKLNGMVHATDLDTDDPLVHYNITAGLAFAF